MSSNGWQLRLSINAWRNSKKPESRDSKISEKLKLRLNRIVYKGSKKLRQNANELRNRPEKRKPSWKE